MELLLNEKDHKIIGVLIILKRSKTLRRIILARQRDTLDRMLMI